MIRQPCYSCSATARAGSQLHSQADRAAVQASTVCKSLALAYTHLPPLSACLHLMTHDNPGVRWDTPLLMALSPKVQSLCLGSLERQAESLAVVLSAAVGLKRLYVASVSNGGAACTDYLVASCCKADGCSYMQAMGPRLPSVYPPSLKHLDIRVWDDGTQSGDWAEVLLYRLARLRNLRTLSVLCEKGARFLCKVLLPRLQRLCLVFHLSSEAHVMLDWAVAQPAEQVDIIIQLDDAQLALSRGLTAQLEQLQRYNLTLHVSGALPKALEQVWSLCDLNKGRRQVEVTNSNLPMAAGMVALLQCLPNWDLRLSCYCIVAPKQRELPWSALVGRSGRICISGSAEATILIGGFDGFLPIVPWQLLIKDGLSVAGKGLPPSQAGVDLPPGTYLLQNEAAVAAGW